MTGGSGKGLVPLLLLKVACCGGLVLATTGAVSGFGAWMIGGGYAWIGLAAIAVLAGVAFRYLRRPRPETGNSADTARLRSIRPVS